MRCIIFLLLLWVSLVSYSRQITADEAQEIAAASIGHAVSYMNNSSSGKSTFASVNTKEWKPYYVFNSIDNHGFVIISGDDRTNRVLAYSDKESVHPNSMPPQLTELLTQFEERLSAFPESYSNINLYGENNEVSNDKILLETVNWGQGYPYNGNTPIFNGKHAQTGCIATAMAIILKYHNWPLYTYGDEITNFYHNDIKIDYNNSSIDWNAINENTEKFNEAVANLMLLTGTSIHTHYEESGSGASMNGITKALMATFGYDTDCCYISKRFYADDEWHSILDEQLRSGLPVIYGSTYEGSWEGHTYVIDGKDNEYYHVNWGWDGDCNGYYSLDLLMPNESNYTDHQSMIINIRPEMTPNPKSISRLHIVYGWNMTFRTGKINCTSEKIQKNVPLAVTGPVLAFPNKFHGTLNFALVDENNEIVEFAKSMWYKGSFDKRRAANADDYYLSGSEGWRLDNSAGSRPLEAYSLADLTRSFIFTDTDIKPDYRVILMSKEDDDNEWKQVYGLNGMLNYIPVNGINSEWSEIEWTYDPARIKIKHMEALFMGESINKVLRYQNYKNFNIIYGGGTARVYVNDTLIDNSVFSDGFLGEFYDNIEGEYPRLMIPTDLPKYNIKIEYTPDNLSEINSIHNDTNSVGKIYNLFGELIYEGEIRNSNLLSGIYVVKTQERVYKIYID